MTNPPESELNTNLIIGLSLPRVFPNDTVWYDNYHNLTTAEHVVDVPGRLGRRYSDGKLIDLGGDGSRGRD